MLLRSGIVLVQPRQALPRLRRRWNACSRPRLPDCRCAEALNWLGKSYSRLGLRDEAVETYLKLVRMYPESDWADDALYLTGNVYREANDMKKALKYYRRLADGVSGELPGGQRDLVAGMGLLQRRRLPEGRADLPGTGQQVSAVVPGEPGAVLAGERRGEVGRPGQGKAILPPQS